MKNRILFSTLVGACFLLLCSCETSDKKPSPSAPLVQDQYRLKEDREAFNEIRKDIPDDKKKQNDEMALVLNWMSDIQRPPGDVREKFDSIVTKKRNLFQKDMEKHREEFVKKERIPKK